MCPSLLPPPPACNMLGDALRTSVRVSTPDLSGAYKLNGDGTTQMVTNEELHAQAAYLAGATMSDGKKYEDWLNSKDREEDG
jgi:hypothetical protein